MGNTVSRMNNSKLTSAFPSNPDGGNDRKFPAPTLAMSLTIGHSRSERIAAQGQSCV